MPPLTKEETVFVTRLQNKHRRVLKARIVALFEDAFIWRGFGKIGKSESVGGGIGSCRLVDEGLTWTRARGVELDAFVVAVEM